MKAVSRIAEGSKLAPPGSGRRSSSGRSSEPVATMVNLRFQTGTCLAPAIRGFLRLARTNALTGASVSPPLSKGNFNDGLHRSGSSSRHRRSSVSLVLYRMGCLAGAGTLSAVAASIVLPPSFSSVPVGEGRREYECAARRPDLLRKGKYL